MITYRMLPPEQFDALYAYIDNCPVAMALPEPGKSIVFVAEDEGRIVGFFSAEAIIHMGSEWIDPDYRKHFGIAPKLFALLQDALAAQGIKFLAAVIDDPEVRGRMLKRVGFKELPGTLYGKVLWDSSQQQSSAAAS